MNSHKQKMHFIPSTFHNKFNMLKSRKRKGSAYISQAFSIKDAPGSGHVTVMPGTMTGWGRTALGSTALVLILAADPSEGLAAQRTEGALAGFMSSDGAVFSSAIIELSTSGDERSPQAGSEWWGHGFKLA